MASPLTAARPLHLWLVHFSIFIQSWETTWEASRQSTLYNQHWTQRIHVGNDKKDLKTFAKLCGQWYVCQTLLVVVSHLMKSRTLWRPMSTLAALFHIFPHISTLFHTLLQSSNVPTSHYTVSAALFRRGLWRRRLEPSHLPILQNHPFFIHDHDPKRPGLGTKTHNCFNWNFSSPSQICELNSLELGQKSPNW